MKVQKRSLTVWTSDKCNHHCRYCFYEEEENPMTQGVTMMSNETADAVIKYINSGLARNVLFFGGEPLVNWPIIKRIIDRTWFGVKSRGSSYSITTNGTLLTPHIINYFKNHRVGMGLSLDGTKATQDYWRDNSYNSIIRNLDLLLDYSANKGPTLKILKTLATPKTLYRDMSHIKSLGFRRVFMNLLDPYSHFTYQRTDLEEFKRQYRRVILNLDSPEFVVADYHKWKKLIEQVHMGNKKMGCGFYNRDLAVGPNGNIYPCLQAPSSEDFVIGNIQDGINEEKEKQIRDVDKAPTCKECVYRINKCPETMFRKHGHYGVDPPLWHMEFELAKIRIIEDMEGLPHLRAGCQPAINEGRRRRRRR